MTRNYQTPATLPHQVSISTGEIAGHIREGLLAMACHVGLQVMATLMDADVEAIAGPRGHHDPTRQAVRHGSEAGSVILGGRRVPIRRPRVRACDGTGELAIGSYQAFTSTDVLSEMVLERMLAGTSTRSYPSTLEPVGHQIDQVACSTSKSTISRRLVTATRQALEQIMSRDLHDLDLPVIMIDGIHFGEHLCLAALGIDASGTKQPLAIVEGSSENTTVASLLLTGLRERGLDTTAPLLVIVDGAKALSAGVTRVFDHPIIQRCQVHKLRNVTDLLPDKLRSTVAAQMQAAYASKTIIQAEAMLTDLAKQLDKTHPGAAASLREGMAETLTVTRLGLDATLARSLRSTNAIESMNSMARDTCRNVKRWRDGDMALRWLAAALLDAQPRWRRIKGHQHLPSLRGLIAHHLGIEGYDNHQETNPEGTPTHAGTPQNQR